MLERFDSCAVSSILISKGSGCPYTAWRYRRSERCREPWLEMLCVNSSAIVAFGKHFEIAFCSLLLSSSLPVSGVSLAVFTIVRMRSAAGNESCYTVSADGAQPLRGFWSFWNCETAQVSWEPEVE